MIIDDERDDSYDDNYHTITSTITPPVNYEAPTSLTIILQREMHLTSRLMFLNFLIRLDQACVEQVPLDHFYLIIIHFLIYYVISIFKCHATFKICNRIKLVCFLKFIVHEINSKMVKSEMVVLTEKEKTDMTNTDMAVGWIL
jgi:hypothetical protein